MKILTTDKCINEVIELYSDMVYRVAFSHARTKHDAEDIYQYVFMKLVEKNPIFGNEEHRKAWILRVTINYSKKVMSSFWRKNVVYSIIDTGQDEETIKEQSELDTVMNKLPQKYRAVIHLYYYEEFKTEEIAVIMSKKASTIRSQIMRGRQLLKKYLSEEENK